jgi:DnaJ family protein B protein 12
VSNSFSRKYPIGRSTANLRVPYYVKENFATEFQGSVRRLEMSVEEEYISNLRHACYREKNYRKGEI